LTTTETFSNSIDEELEPNTNPNFWVLSHLYALACGHVCDVWWWTSPVNH